MKKRKLTTQSVSWLLQDIRPYYSKKETQRIIKRSDGWRKKWESIAIEYIPDFAEHWESRKAFNLHQAFCLATISDWRTNYPTIGQSDLIKMIEDNLDSLTVRAVLQFTSEFSPEKSANVTESTELVKAA